MATYTKLASSVNAYNLTSTILSSTLTAVTLSLSDGSTLVLGGTGLTVSGGVMTAGVINSMTHKDLSNVTVETWTGLNYGATSFQTFLNSPLNEAGLFASILSGSDSFAGNSGADALSGFDGGDTFRGLAGDDVINGGNGNNDQTQYDQDSLTGGNGVVVVNLSSVALNVFGVVAAGTARDGFGNTDTLIGIEEARGGAQGDFFFGGTGYNWFQGRGGADTYLSNATRYYYDYFSGSIGWVDYRQDGGSNGITINLLTGTGTDTFGNTESFYSISGVRGSLFADSIVGSQYYNIFQTLQGNDSVNGGDGIDKVDYSTDSGFGGTAGVTVNLATGVATDGWGNTDTLTSIEQVIGTGVNDSITGNNWDNYLAGNVGNDTLIGGDGFDFLQPGTGADLVNGSVGTGLDQGYDDRDIVSYSELAPGGTGLGVIVNLSAASVVFEGFTVVASTARDTGGSIDTLIDIERARGTSGRDYLIGSSTANLRQEQFRPMAGDDYVDGGSGYNVVHYYNETASITGSGNGGTSGVIVNLSSTSLTANGYTVAAGTARDSFGNTDTLVNIKGVVGSALGDYVLGGSGYDYFEGKGGTDFFDGGAGTEDTLSVFIDDGFFGTVGFGYTVNMVAGSAIGFADNATMTFVNVENIDGSERDDNILGNTADNDLFGDFGNDTIDGGDGNDILTGYAGNDSLRGGTGFDFVNYRYDPTNGSYNLLQRGSVVSTVWGGVTVNLTTGIATDQNGNTDSLAEFEGVAGTHFADNLTGDANDNRFYGFSGNDMIDGAGGNDTVSYANWGNSGGTGAPDLPGINASRPNGVSVNLAVGIAGDSEGGTDTLISIESAIGSVGADILVGSTGDNTLTGGDGSDVIVGDAGVDTVSFSGLRADYATAKNGSSMYFYDLRNGNPDGLETVMSTEKFKFSDGTVSMESFTPTNFNGDLKSDILWRNTAGLAVNFLMDGLNITGASVVGNNGASWAVKAVGDLNGDGQSDLVWQDTSGLVVAYLMNGSVVASAAVVANAGAAFRVVGCGDLNADGNSDIVLQDNNGLAVGWQMNGLSIANAAALGGANGAAWSVRAIGDLNRDGKDDLIWNDTGGSTVGFLMNGLSVASASLIVGANGPNFSVKGAGDLNGDGKDDLIWQFSNGQAGAWLMDGLNITGGNAIGGANGSQFEIRNVSDLNGDGMMDLVWQDMNAGQAIGFLMNGLNITGAGAIGGANGAGWTIV